jgi:hypothetical protein
MKHDTEIKNAVKKLFSMFNVKTNFENIPKHNTIFVVNYPKLFYDCLATMLIPKDIAIIMVNRWDTKNTWGNFLFKPIYKEEKNSYEYIKKQISKQIQKTSVLAYVMKPRSLTFRTGIFRIAKELNLTVTPIVMDTIKIENCQIIKQNFQIYIGDSFLVNDIDKDICQVKKLFKKKIKIFRDTKTIL